MTLTTSSNLSGGRRGERGFSMVQIVITMAVVAVVTTFAVMQIAVARDQMRLTGATREFAGYAEKARLDSIRRHGDGTIATPASVKLASAAGYTANYDQDYDGALDERDFDLPEGVTVTNVAVTTGSATVTVVPTAASPVQISFDWRGRTANAYRITFTNSSGHESVVGITAAGEVSVDRKAITLSAGSYSASAGDSGSLGPNGTSAGVSNSNSNSSNSNTNSSNTNSNTSNSNSNSSNTNSNTSNSNSNSSNTNSNTSNSNSNSSNTNSNSSNGNSNSSNSNSNSSNSNSNSSSGTQQCSMTISPASTEASAIVLHNGDGPTSTTVTVTFNNPPVTGASFTLSQIPNKIDVTVSGNTITIKSKNGTGNQGNYSFRVTPNTACGTFQKVYVNVVN